MKPLEKPPIVRVNPFANSSHATKERVRAYVAASYGDTGFHPIYSYTKGFLLPLSRKAIVERLRSTSGHVHVLDLGPGLGKGMHDARSINPRVNPFGLALYKPTEAQLKRFGKGFRERFIAGQFERIMFPDYFGVIQSVYGLQHATNHAIALENALNSLAEGGVLVTSPNELTHFSRSETIDENLLKRHAEASESHRKTLEIIHPDLAYHHLLTDLEKQGFMVSEHWTPLLTLIWTAIMERRLLEPKYLVIRRGKGKADLSAFYHHPVLNRVTPD